MSSPRVFLAALCLALAACNSTTTTASSTTTTIPATTTTVAPAEYVPAAGEPVPNAKALASKIAVALTTYPASADPAAAVRPQLQALGVPEQFITAAGPLLQPNKASIGTAIYPQLGGLTKDKTAMMTVTQQKLTDATGVETTVTRTLDIALTVVNGVWQPTSLDSYGGDEIARPDNMSAEQIAFLDNPRITMPDTARWDVYRNAIDHDLLAQVDRLAKDHDISIAVLETGHPHNVFNTNKTSNHTRGRAADIWKLDGVLIVEQRNDALKALMQSELDAGVTELGGPFDIDGAANHSFTDEVHQDHLHIGLRLPPGTPDPAAPAQN